MSTTSAPAPAPDVPIRRAAAMPRIISAFSGTTGLAVKLVLLAVMNALAVWAAYVARDAPPLARDRRPRGRDGR